MSRRRLPLLILALSAFSSLAAVCRVATPAPTPGETAVVRVRKDGALVAGATVQVNVGQPLAQKTDALGGAVFLEAGSTRDLQVAVTLEGCTTYNQSRHFELGQEIDVALQCAPPIPDKPTVDELLTVRANFCNLADESGEPQFTIFLLGLPKETRQTWYARQRAAGSTHIVLSPVASYPGAPWPGGDVYANPSAFVDLVEEVAETPSATGKGFVPILFLDGGDPNPRPRIQANWPPIVAELQKRGLLEHVIICPGWELVPASAWSSADLSVGLELLHSLGVPHIAVELGPTRASGASNPVAPDDPWQGAEADFWKGHGGEWPELFFYESENLTQSHDVAACNKADPNCWLSRWDDVVPRLGNGMNGWRVMHLVLFETVAFGAWHHDATPDYARDVATAGQAMCASYQVACGFGNGLPR